MSAAIADPDKNTQKETHSNQLNAPNISAATGKPTQRAISNAKQAYSIAKSLRDRAIDGRLRTAAFVGKAYNGEPPFYAKDLQRTGQAWRNNFSTQFLGGILDRVKPQITEPLNAADLLVTKSLPADWPESATKSRKFNEVATKTVRGWVGWKDFLSGLAQEVITHGCAVATRLGEDWRPRMWAYDEAYLPEGTGQHASKVQVLTLRQPILMHEFIRLFEDKEAAKKAGYNYEGCIKVANKNSSKRAEESPTDREDAVRELSSLEHSYGENQAKVVWLYHVLAHDYTGEVDLWTVSADDGEEVRQVKNLADAMPHCVTLFTMQTGNRKFYGSKGLGRLITNLHVAIERNRNFTADKVNASGFPIVKSDDPTQTQLQLRYPFMVAPMGTELLLEAFTVDWAASEGLDNKLVSIAESIAGAFIPPQIDQSGSSKTKIEAAQKAERDIAVRQGVLSRFADHCRDLLDMVCTGMFSPLALREGKRAWEDKKRKTDNKVIVVLRAAWRLLKKAFVTPEGVEPVLETPLADEAAVAAVVELLDAGLTINEIAMLAVTPSAANNEDEGAAHDNATLQWIGTHKGDPRVDQQKATEMEANIVIGESRAKQLIIPGDDHNVRDAAIRWQTIEVGEMLDGRAMPVVGADNHPVHRQTLAKPMQAIVESLAQAPTPAMVAAAKLMLGHYDQHIEQDLALPPELKTQEEGALRQLYGQVQAAEKALAQAAQEAAAQGGQPGAPASNGVAPADTNPNDDLFKASELALETKRVAQEDRRMTLEEDKHRHKADVDAATLQQRNMEIVAKAAEGARKQGLEEAKQDLAQTATQV